MDLISYLYNSDVEGVICKECASRLQGLTTFPEFPVSIFTKGNKSIHMESMEVIAVEELDLKYTSEIIPKLSITIPERTVIDLIRFSVEDRWIYEALENSSLDETLLNLIASDYGVMGEFLLRKKLLNEWRNDFYE